MALPCPVARSPDPARRGRGPRGTQKAGGLRAGAWAWARPEECQGWQAAHWARGTERAHVGAPASPWTPWTGEDWCLDKDIPRTVGV